MRCRHKKGEDCGLLSFERPDFCDELCEEFVPADLPEAGASAERISSVVRSNATAGWIKVSEKLPEDGEDVLVFDSSEGMKTAVYELNTFSVCEDYNTCYRYLNDVTHWMPLPEMPGV